MTLRVSRFLISLVTVAMVLMGAGRAQQPDLPGGPGQSKTLPIKISADNGIEWRQAQHVYIARGHVKAQRGDDTVYADEMRAYYRPVANKTKTATKAPTSSPAKPSKTGFDFAEGSTQIYRIEASGNVRFVTPTQTAYGDHAVYDIDAARLVLTGKHLRVVTQHDTLTARDSIEWYDKRQLGVARGDAVDIHDGKRIAADVLMATIVQPKGEAARISRIDAQGHVLVSSKDQIGRANVAVYNAKSGIVTLLGHVRLTRGRNELRGAYGVVDLNRNIGRLLPAPPGHRAGAHRRVEGLIVPNEIPGAPGTAKPGVKSSRP